MSNDQNRWDRLHWGVHFSMRPEEAPVLISSMWDMDRVHRYFDDEPQRALLFTTRAKAREWCASEMRELFARPNQDGCVKRWKLRPVRVRETVVVVGANREAELSAMLDHAKDEADEMERMLRTEINRLESERDMLKDQQIATEREKCAKLCEDIGPEMCKSYGDSAECINTANACAEAIRQHLTL